MNAPTMTTEDRIVSAIADLCERNETASVSADDVARTTGLQPALVCRVLSKLRREPAPRVKLTPGSRWRLTERERMKEHTFATDYATATAVDAAKEPSISTPPRLEAVWRVDDEEPSSERDASVSKKERFKRDVALIRKALKGVDLTAEAIALKTGLASSVVFNRLNKMRSKKLVRLTERSTWEMVKNRDLPPPAPVAGSQLDVLADAVVDTVESRMRVETAEWNGDPADSATAARDATEEPFASESTSVHPPSIPTPIPPQPAPIAWSHPEDDEPSPSNLEVETRVEPSATGSVTGSAATCGVDLDTIDVERADWEGMVPVELPDVPDDGDPSLSEVEDVPEDDGVFLQFASSARQLGEPRSVARSRGILELDTEPPDGLLCATEDQLCELRACIDEVGVWPDEATKEARDYEACVRHMAARCRAADERDSWLGRLGRNVRMALERARGFAI